MLDVDQSAEPNPHQGVVETAHKVLPLHEYQDSYVTLIYSVLKHLGKWRNNLEIMVRANFQINLSNCFLPDKV